MDPSSDQRQTFRDLHNAPFIMPNPWDIGSAKILASLGFAALATTSAGFANTLGRPDGCVTRDEAISHADIIDRATPLPVNADLENGFGDDVEAVRRTIKQALATDIAGASIEDYGAGAIYSRDVAIDRIRAAVDANRQSDSPLVLTARAENFIRGNPNLSDTIERLQAFQEAGADVLYAPGLVDLGQIRSLVSALDRPVNILIMPGGPTVPELFQAGAIRISTGSAINTAIQSAIVNAARELQGPGTQKFWLDALPDVKIVSDAMSGDA